MPKPRRKPAATLPFTAKAWIALDAGLPTLVSDEALAANPTVWVEVTCEGNYKGYPGGGFKFDTSIFGELIKNFRANPSYVKGADGYGSADVVPWDFNHASEYPSTDGSVPIVGAPAQGWIQDLEVRMDKAGKTGLFAKTRWLEPARTYVKNGQYKWASVTVIFDARDPKTNEKVGCLLTSVALTNTPFVEGMEELVAASRQVAAGSYVGGSYCEPACDADGAFEAIRSLFGLPATAGMPDVLGQLAQLQSWAVSGGAPMGVELDELIGGIRVILNMPALSGTDEVFAEVQKLLTRMLEEDALEAADSSVVTQPQTPPGALPPAPMSRSGDPMSFKLIASKLGVVETQAACEGAVEGLVNLRAAICKRFGLDPNVSDAKLLEAGDGAGDVRGKLAAILAALGLSAADSDQAINKLASVMEQATQLKAVMPELEGLKAKAAEAEVVQEKADVEAALASRNMSGDEGMRLVFTAARKADAKAFAEKFLTGTPPAAAGTPVAAAAATALTRSIAGKGAAEHKVTVDPLTGAITLASAGRAGAPASAGGDRPKIVLSGHPGRNQTERMIAYLRAHGDDKMSFEDLFTKACTLLKSGSEIVDDAA